MAKDTQKLYVDKFKPQEETAKTTVIWEANNSPQETLFGVRSSMVCGMVSFSVGSHFHKVGSQNKIKTKCDEILIYSYHA